MFCYYVKPPTSRTKDNDCIQCFSSGQTTTEVKHIIKQLKTNSM